MRVIIIGIRLGVVLCCLTLPGVGAAEAPKAEQLKDRVVLVVRGDRLSASVNAPLKKVMKELASHIPLKVYFTGAVGEEKVSAVFEDLPLEEGAKRILANTSYTLSYRESPASPRTMEIKLATSHTGTPGSEPQTVVVSPAQDHEKERQALIDKALRAPDSRERLAALQALQARFPMEEILPTMIESLKDKDKNVKRFVLSAVDGAGANVPIEPVAEMIQQANADPITQFGAIAYLARSYRGESANTLYRVAEDPTKHKTIRRQARRMLDWIEGKTKIEEPSPEEPPDVIEGEGD